MNRRYFAKLLVLASTALVTVPAFAQDREKGVGDFPKLSADRDWPWWRGPTRNGIAAEAPNANLPTQWSETENVIWKADVPGRGHASPIVVDGKIYLTTADEQKQAQSIVAFDAATGRQLWKSDISQGGFPPEIHKKNTHASPTVACDGERLFVTLHHTKAVHCIATDLTGKVLWKTTFAAFDPGQYPFGYAPSPVVYRDTVIVAAESDGERCIAALDRATGKQVWKTARTTNTSYSTPSIGFVAGRDQLLMSGGDQITGYDPATGKQLWTAPGTAAATCGTAVWEGDIVIASGGFPKSNTSAVKADGSGKVVWSVPQKLYEQSLMAYHGHVYGLLGNGMLYCWRTADGKEMWKQRFLGPVSASGVVAGGHIYWANERGTVYVFKANPEKLEMVAQNVLGDESMASPAIAGGRIYLRVAHNGDGGRKETLYCIGKKE
ncbi:outer membrane protein assembly factor BamB family protein [Humisphaera borealis]|uniref:PQQ-binding-like beta-propeller repeat protein n=1 Tax=Humisphaera borealis TaxID=2807512 RepID=A0A7M2WY75_9BACT|nr:PQQ-binding-like beta-propeller repeat protein [Humisphaera borealis]QOV89470.1 PQQ-binding-like beta-propeller repeat protein [Humisphaera borealis]